MRTRPLAVALPTTDAERMEARKERMRLALGNVFSEIIDDALEHDLEPEAVRAYWSYGLRNFDGAPLE